MPCTEDEQAAVLEAADQAVADEVSADLAAPVATSEGAVSGVFLDYTEPEDVPVVEGDPAVAPNEPYVEPVPAVAADAVPNPVSEEVQRPAPSGAVDALPAEATAQSQEPEQPVVPTNPDAEGNQIEDPTHPADVPVELQPDPVEVHEHKIEADKLGVEAEFAERTKAAQAQADERQAAEVEATPAAEAHAEEKGVDLTEVEGTGKDGRVTAPDVDAAAETPPPEG